MAAFCLICYKQILQIEENIEDTGTNVNGLQLLQKFYKVLHGVLLNFNSADAHVISVCDLCSTVLRKYCDLHLDLEAVRLKMMFQMQTLKSVMYQAARVTKRVDQFQQDLFKNMEELEKQSNLKNALNLRENIYSNCKAITKSGKKLFVSLEVNPSIKVETYQQARSLHLKTENLLESLTSDNAVNPTDEEMDDKFTTSFKMEQPYLKTSFDNMQDNEDSKSNSSSEDSASSHDWDSENHSGTDQSSMESMSSHESEKERKCKPRKSVTIPSIHCPVPECGKLFQEAIHLQLHTKLHGKFICNFCPYTCNLADQLMRHEWIEHSDKSNLKKGKTYKCSRCAREFNSFRNARGAHHFYIDHLHIEYWNGECSKCGRKFQVQKGSMQKAQERHFRHSSCKANTNTNDGKFYCPFENCAESFTIKNQLTMHAKMHGKFSCKFCTFTANLADKLLDHEWQSHTIEEEGIFKCSRCPKTFAAAKPALNDAHRKKHFFIEHLGLEYQQGECHICGQSFAATSYSFEQSMKMHMKQHDIDKSKAVYCDICNAPFESWRRIVFHKLKVHKRSCYDCPVCKKAFNRTQNLNSHIKVHHKSFDLEKANAFACTFENCGARFLNQVTLDLHKDRHGEPMRQCDLCSKWILDKCAMKMHMKRHKGIEERRKVNVHKKCSVVCDLCGKICYGKSKVHAEYSLQLHKSSKLHDGEWEHSCEMCGKRCQTLQKLEEHIIIHTKEKPFLCNVCGREFSIKYNLKRHVKLVHESKKPDDNNENDNS